MLKTRIIPVLLWDHVAACKPVKFKRPYRRVGSMMQNIKVLNDRNIDELYIIDISGNNEPAYDKIKEFTSECFMPVTVGGGIQNAGHIEKLLKSGADKVLVSDMSFPEMNECAKQFGSQCIVKHIVYNEYGQQYIKYTAKTAQDEGAGEILLTCVNKDGTFEGYDLDTIKDVSSYVRIPVVANGGCASPQDMVDAINAGAHGVAASSIFLYTEYTPLDCAKALWQNNIPARVEANDSKNNKT